MCALFVKFPQFDGVGVGSEHFVIFTLRRKPTNVINLLLHWHALQTIELPLVRLELKIVFVVRVSFSLIHPAEDDHPACSIAQRQHLSRWIEPKGRDLVLLDALLAEAAVPEELGALERLNMAILLRHFPS